MHISRWDKDGKLGDRIADGIIMQGVHNVAAFRDIKVPYRDDQLMLSEKVLHDFAKILTIINKRFKMLISSISIG